MSPGEGRSAVKDKYILNMLRNAQPSDKEIQEFIHLAKSDLGQDFIALGLEKYKVIPYGSAVNGLFTQSSDLDFMIHCGHPVSKEQATTMVNKLAKILKARVRRNVALYRDIVTMTNGRVPVVKFLHVAMDREINISFTSHVGVHNSYLVKHLLTLDSRIRPMMLLLKIYFKTKLSPGTLTTFNLYCLIIFALQNLQKPLLPPLKYFLAESPSMPLVENRWPIQFDLKPFPNKNSQTLMELILDFCSFYASFDFENSVIAPYSASQEHLGLDFKFNRLINIQDFLVLNQNLGSDCHEFQPMCQMHHEHRDEYATIKNDAELGQAFFARVPQRKQKS